MKVLIYRQKGKIYKIQDIEGALERVKTIEALEESIKTFNKSNTHGNTCEIHQVPEGEEEFYNLMMTSGDWLYGDDTKGILHSVLEEVPSNRYIYVIYKHEGHDTLTFTTTKFLSSGRVQLASVKGEQGVLPIAWCYARDLIGQLNLTRGEVKKLFQLAENHAWPWYNKK